MRRASVAALAAALAWIGLAAPAAADDVQESKDLFDRGVAALEAGKYEVACPALARSNKLDPHLGTLFALADCEAKWGHGAAAVARYAEYLRLYAALPRDKQLRQGDRDRMARAAKAQLEKSLPTITIVLAPGAPPGTVVTSDGAAVPPEALGSAVFVDPGEHVIAARAPGGPVSQQRVHLGKGEKETVRLEVHAAPAPEPAPASPPPEPPSTGPSGRRIGAWVATGIGAAGLLVGAVTGGLMLSKKSAISAGCKPGPGGVEDCNATGASAGNAAKTLGAAASAGFVIGLAGVATGLGLFLSEPAKPSEPRAGLHPRAHGVFAGALELGPGGVLLGVRGDL